MTVEELIHRLRDFPPDVTVGIYGEFGDVLLDVEQLTFFEEGFGPCGFTDRADSAYEPFVLIS